MLQNCGITNIEQEEERTIYDIRRMSSIVSPLYIELNMQLIKLKTGDADC